VNSASTESDDPFPRPWNTLVHFWVFLTVLVPIIGTFYPPETYFRDALITDQNFQPSFIMPPLLVTMSLSIIILFVYIRRKQKIYHDWPIYGLVFLFFANWILFNPEPSAFFRVLRSLPYVGFAVLYSQCYSFERIVRVFLLAYFVSAVASVVMGIIFPIYGHSHYTGTYENLWRGAIVEKNAAGLTYALGLLISISAALQPRPQWRLIWSTGLLCTFLIVMTQSVTVILCLFVILPSLFLLALYRKSTPSAALLATMAVLFGAFSLIITIWLTPESFAVFFGRDATLTGRSEIWSEVWDLVKQRPIMGYGYGFWGIPSFERDRIWTHLGFTPLHSHNTWLDLMLQVGLIGMIFVLFDLIRSFFIGLWLVTKGVNNAILPLSIIVLVSLRSFTEVGFTEPGIYGLFWLTWTSIMLRIMYRNYVPANHQ